MPWEYKGRCPKCLGKRKDPNGNWCDECAGSGRVMVTTEKWPETKRAVREVAPPEVGREPWALKLEAAAPPEPPIKVDIWTCRCGAKVVTTHTAGAEASPVGCPVCHARAGILHSVAAGYMTPGTAWAIASKLEGFKS